jgi:hypothetical protein
MEVLFLNKTFQSLEPVLWGQHTFTHKLGKDLTSKENYQFLL